MKIKIVLPMIILIHMLLQPLLLSEINVFKEPEKLRSFIIKTTTIPLFSKQWFSEQLQLYTRSFIISSVLNFTTNYITAKFGKPFLIKNTIKKVLEEEKKKPGIEENILQENNEIIRFINTVSKDNFNFASILLYGPPGTGKTTFARWLAKEISAPLYPFTEIAGELKLKSFLGKSITPENLLAYLVSMIKNRNDQKKIIVLFDEFDLLYKKIKNFKNLISGLKEDERFNNIIFMATTNYILDIPEAEIDRFEYKIYVDYSALWIKEALSLSVKKFGLTDNISTDLILEAFKNITKNLSEKGLSEKHKALIKTETIEDNELYLPKISLRIMENAIKHAMEDEDFDNFSPVKKSEIIAKELYKELWFKKYLSPLPAE